MAETKPTVLVIDDEAAVRRALEQQLKYAGYPAVTARDGAHAIEILETTRADLALIDLVMPGKDGVQTITNLRITHPEIRIIAMSGDSNSQMYLKAAQGLGVKVRLEKPFTYQQLTAALEQAMGDQ